MTLTIDLDTTDTAALAAALTELAEARRQLATAQRRVQTALTNVLGRAAVPNVLGRAAVPNVLGRAAVPNVATPLTAEALGLDPSAPSECISAPEDAPLTTLVGEFMALVDQAAQESNDGPDLVKVEPTVEESLTEQVFTCCQETTCKVPETVAPKSTAYPSTNPRYVTAAEASAIAGVSRRAIAQWVEKGWLEVARTEKVHGLPERHLYLRSNLERIMRERAGKKKGGPKPTPKIETPAPKIETPAPKIEAPAPKVAPAEALFFPAERPARPSTEGLPVRVVESEPLFEGRPAIDQTDLYDAIEAGKAAHPNGFWIVWRVEDDKPVVVTSAGEELIARKQHGWMYYERWSRNGLGRWESTPANPGAVGVGVGTVRGIQAVGVPQ